MDCALVCGVCVRVVCVHVCVCVCGVVWCGVSSVCGGSQCCMHIHHVVAPVASYSL